MSRRAAGLVTAALLICVVMYSTTGCAVAPKIKDRAAFVANARAATSWFEDNVPGLREQIDDSAGYVIFPSIAQWGIVYGGGKWGRGIVNDADDSQIGWAAINTLSLGLQAGIQGFKMLVVVEDAATLKRLRQDTLVGSVSGVAVAGNVGGSAQASFDKGLAVYQGANAGLMAGVNVGLDLLRYEAWWPEMTPGLRYGLPRARAFQDGDRPDGQLSGTMTDTRTE